LRVDGRDLPRSTDLNVGEAGSATYTVAGTSETVSYHRFGTGPSTNFARVISFQSTAESEYNGLTLELNRRFANRFSARLAYTLGKVVDTVPDATAVVPGSSTDDAKYASNPKDFDADRTVGNNDQRHRFVFSGVYDTGGPGSRAFVRNWTLSTIFTASSGQPYSARVGNVDLNNDGNTRNDYAPGTVRNQYSLPNYYALDLRVARSFPLARKLSVQPIFEVFNFTNADNIIVVNQALYGVNTATNVLTPNTSFAQPTTTAGQRIIQLAVRFTF
jgi:hypothetical protein